MDQSPYRRHRFSPPIIQHAIWLYLRFTLSYRDVGELLAERGLEVPYGNRAAVGFEVRARVRPPASTLPPTTEDRWHLDEMVVRIAGKRMYLWRAVDHEGEVLDILAQHRRDKRLAARLRYARFAIRSSSRMSIAALRAALFGGSSTSAPAVNASPRTTI